MYNDIVVVYVETAVALTFFTDRTGFSFHKCVVLREETVPNLDVPTHAARSAFELSALCCFYRPCIGVD